MSNTNPGYTINMQLTAQIIIKVPIDLRTGKGHFPKEKGEIVIVNGQYRKHEGGFVVEFISVGHLEEVSDSEANGEPTIKYVQDQNKENRIYFFNNIGDYQIINIISMPIHDHSSVSSGGPAFGTYYSAKDIQED